VTTTPPPPAAPARSPAVTRGASVARRTLRPRVISGRRLVRAAGLLACCGVVASLALTAAPEAMAQSETDAERFRDMSPEERRAFVAERQREERLRRYREQLERRGSLSESEIEELLEQERQRLDRQAEMAARIQGGAAPETVGRDDPDRLGAEPQPIDAEQPAPGGETAPGVEGALAGGEPIRLAFPDEVSLARVVDVVSEGLGVNIIAAPGLENETVIITRPIERTADEMLTLLSVLLDDRGYVLQEGDDGILRINRAGNMQIRVGEGPLSTTRVIPTPNLRPSALQQMLQNVLMGAGGGGQPGNVQGGGAVSITPLDELGVIVASGSATRLDNVERLIELLVQADEAQRLHLLPVTNVAASFARDRMIELQGQLASGPQGLGGVQNRVQPGAQQLGASASLSRLADRLYVHAGNSLLFRGTPEELRDVEDLLRVVDQISPLVARRYQTGAVTQEVVQAAQALGLGAIEQIEEATNQSLRQQFAQRGQLAVTPNATAIGDSRFVVDTENGTVIYFGTPEQHERVDELVKQFRADMIDNGTQIRVYKLLYASAAGGGTGGGTGGGGGVTTTGAGGAGGSVSVINNDRGVAEILTDLIQDPQTARAEGRFVSPGGFGAEATGVSAAEDAIISQQAAQVEDDSLTDLVEDALGGTRLVATEENTVIVADGSRNQVIIKAPALAHRQFEAIIGQLDRKRPQVQIDVRIVSLTTNDSFDWSTAYDFNIGDFNLSGLFGAASGTDSITELITVPAPAPGLTMGVINSDYVPFALNTLETLGTTDVVSRPNVLVNDNAPASYVSITQIPFAETTQNANTTTTGQGGVAEAGTRLNVVPRISGAGEVTLALELELSDFIGEATGNLQPPAQQDTFNSQVTLPTNATIIIGGFSLSREQETEAGIPLLKDIPILGNLFKRVSISSNERVIFLFITPTIIEETDDVSLRLLSEGPLRAAGYDDGMPRFEPVLMPIRSRTDDIDRSLERLDLSSLDRPRTDADL